MKRIHPRVVATCAALLAYTACTKDQAKADSAAARPDSTAAATVTRDSGARPMVARDTSARGNNGWTDSQILAFAHAASDGEVAEGQLAEKKATSPGVKAFARQMVADHRAMVTEGKAFAAKNHIEPDTTKDVVRDILKDSRDQVKDLTDKAAGADWDKSYLDHEIDGHQKVLDKLQDAAKNTTNADLRAMLVKATGKVQEHLTKARALKEKYAA